MRFLNGVSFLNTEEKVFNGTTYNTVIQPTVYDSSSYKGADLLSDATNGMQVPMNWDTKNSLRIVNTRNLQIDTFSHAASTSIGSPPLEIE